MAGVSAKVKRFWSILLCTLGLSSQDLAMAIPYGVLDTTATVYLRLKNTSVQQLLISSTLVSNYATKYLDRTSSEAMEAHS